MITFLLISVVIAILIGITASYWGESNTGSFERARKIKSMDENVIFDPYTWSDLGRLIAIAIGCLLVGFVLVEVVEVLKKQIGLGYIPLQRTLILGVVLSLWTFYIIWDNVTTQIKEVHFAVTSIFDSLSGRRIGEGNHFLWPFIEKVKDRFLFPFKTQTKTTQVVFVTKMDESDENLDDESDNKISSLKLTVTLAIQWRVDPEIVTGDGSPAFVEWSGSSEGDLITKEFNEALEAQLEGPLGSFGGVYEYVKFVNKREWVELFLNSLLRLETVPHENPRVLEKYNEYTEASERIDESDIEREDDFEYMKEEVPPGKRLEFYRDNSDIIKTVLSGESENDSRSEIELLLGIDLIDLRLKKVGFTEEAKEKIEAEAQAREQQKARQVEGETLQNLTDIIAENTDLDDETAASLALVLMGKSSSYTLNTGAFDEDIGQAIDRILPS
ncbi:MAG: hypothetical protein ABEI53_01980 [Candidatus Magasanikbacteria bacterium]